MKRIAIAVVAVGAIVAIVLALVIGRSPSAGPFAWPSDAGRSWVIDVAEPNQVRAFGVADTKSVDQPATILAVRPLPTDDPTGVRLRYAACTCVMAHTSGAHGWRPEKWKLHPLPSVIPAHTTMGIVVGMSARKRGVYFLHGFVIDYEIGGTRYSSPQYFGVKFCVARFCS